jgi:metal transporter CNNM
MRVYVDWNAEATPLRSIRLNKVPSVPFDESLLGILDRFQEGRSHMAIVSLFSKGRAASVKDAVKTGLTRRMLNRVGLGEDDEERSHDLERAWGELREGKIGEVSEEGTEVAEKETGLAAVAVEKERVRRFTAGIEGREQAMPADAVLASEDADKVRFRVLTWSLTNMPY